MSAATRKTADEREFSFSNKEFDLLRKVVRSQTGIVLNDQKKEMVYGRLARRIREIGLADFGEYCDLIQSPAGSHELEKLVNAITTNLTKFFREEHHFKHLAKYLKSITLDADRRTKDSKIRIWSAACSSGEEPYSIAMTVSNSITNLAAWDIKILATDLDTNMLQTGKTAEYKSDSEENVPSIYHKRMFEGSKPDRKTRVIARNLRDLVTFKQLNLLHKWPLRQKYDAIFCRNVLIYFDSKTKTDLVKRYIDQLAVGGILYLGHSESLLDNTHGLQLVGQTTYRKVC
ncbi:MAG: protein-glutamate O-methyltransferase CheR [Sneathiella sp.]